MTSNQIEIAIARLFGERINIIVPNISWGFNIHECDLLIITKTNYAIEVEIKITKQDLLADQKKRHLHISNKIRRLFFAIPEKLQPYINNIPDKAGIIIIQNNYKCTFIRKAKTNINAYKLTQDEILKIAHLGCMRTWKLRETINRLILGLNEKNELS